LHFARIGFIRCNFRLADHTEQVAMRLRFTIRDLLWLAVLVAVSVAWWMDHRRFANFQIWVDENGTKWIQSSEARHIWQVGPTGAYRESK
jgi:hypothetical protein